MIRRINFHSVPVTDQDRAVAFYRDRLGFSVHVDAPYDEGWRWIFMTLPGAETRLQFARRSDIEVRDVPALCLVADDVDDEARRLGADGVEIVGGPDDAPWMDGVRWLMIRDSEGNMVLLESLRQGG